MSSSRAWWKAVAGEHLRSIFGVGAPRGNGSVDQPDGFALHDRLAGGVRIPRIRRVELDLPDHDLAATTK